MAVEILGSETIKDINLDVLIPIVLMVLFGLFFIFVLWRWHPNFVEFFEVLD